MKSTLALIAMSSVIALTCATSAEAKQSIRADLPYPYGPGGSPDDAPWTLLSGGPFESIGNSGLSEPFNYVLASDNDIVTDQVGVAVVGANTIQDVGYAAAVPTAPYSETPPVNDIAPGPTTQILDYLVAPTNLIPGLESGGTEIQFNYDFSVADGTLGTASLTFGGVTFTSMGTTLPTQYDDNFVFDSTGKFLGSFSEDPITDIVSLTGGSAPQGWTSSAGGTTTTSAPEIDPSSAAAGMTLLVGGLLVMRSGRRTLKVIR